MSFSVDVRAATLGGLVFVALGSGFFASKDLDRFGGNGRGAALAVGDAAEELAFAVLDDFFAEAEANLGEVAKLASFDLAAGEGRVFASEVLLLFASVGGGNPPLLSSAS